MSKPRAIPLAAQVEAAVERAEKAEGQIAALDHGLKAAHHQARCLKGELTKLQEAQKVAKARIKELEDYMRMYNNACRDRTNARIAHEAAKFQADTVVTLPSSPRERLAVVAVYLTGMALGALVGGLFL